MINNKLKIFVISDIHFGIKDSSKLFNELNEIFIPKLNETVDAVIIAGDLFDRILKLNENSCLYVFNFVIDTLINLSKLYNFKIRIIKGTKTHDFNQLQNFEKYTNENFKIIESVYEEELFPNHNVLYLPEEYIENEDEYYKDYFNKKYNSIFFHGNMDFASYSSHIQTIKGTKNSPNFSSSKIASLSIGAVIGGHVHIRQSYNNKIFYTGSFTRFKFGEPENKGFIEYLYDINTNEYEINYIDNNLAPIYTTINFTDLEGTTLEEKLSLLNTLKEEYDNIRIDVSSKDTKANSVILEALNNLTDENIKLKVNTDFKEEYDDKYDFILKQELPLAETIKKFVQMNYNKNLDIEKINKFLNHK